MARTFSPMMSIHDYDDRALEYFELDRPIRTIRSHCHYLNGGAPTSVFDIEPCRNSRDLVYAIQRLAQMQEQQGVFGFGTRHDVYILKVTVNKVSATVVLG